MKEDKTIAKNSQITDEDIEAWASIEAIQHRGKSDAWIDDRKKALLFKGAKAMRDGLIKHIL